MSRIANKPIQIPAGVEVRVDNGRVLVKGPKGELTRTLHDRVRVVVGERGVEISVLDNTDATDRALWGTFGSHVKNMLRGVTMGYTKKLEINGIGYRAEVKGRTLVLNVGYTHPVEFPIPDGLTITMEKNVIVVNSIDKEIVGQAAAEIRGIKEPEPYQGKGIKYSDEVIRRKAGKAVKAGAGGAA
ncbi:50S ribosomal protein L6 [Candidatus Uhrbacteria bacterium]|nr:50S ribosomal protein L6 [Candidatus Uhrbacteria bacterium]